jgi:hypothetical protein
MVLRLIHLILFSVFTLLLLSFYPTSSYSNTKKKILLSKLQTPKDIKSINPDIILDRLKNNIIERYQKEYFVISELDLEHILDQAEEIQKHGRDASKLLSQVAEARESDEFITGKILFENGKIRLILTNLSREKDTSPIFTKSVVDLYFSESELDSYLLEAAIKIIQPRYKINLAKKIHYEFIKNTEEPFLQTSNLIWGDFEGVLKWEEANSICISKGMRLPSPEELKRISLAKHFQLVEPCCVFWTSLENNKDDDYAYYININDGYGSFYHKELDIRVRCVKSALDPK